MILWVRVTLLIKGCLLLMKYGAFLPPMHAILQLRVSFFSRLECRSKSKMRGQLLHRVLQQKEEWGEIVTDGWLPFGEFLIHWRNEMNSGNSIGRTINWNKHANIEAPSSNSMLLQVLYHLNLRSPLNPSKSGTHSDRMLKLLHPAHVQLLYSHMRLNGTQLCY